MPSAPRPDVASTGRRLRQRVPLALTLSAALPMLVLAYIVYAYVLPVVDPHATAAVYGLSALLLFTMLALGAGAYIIWDLGRTVARMAETITHQPRAAPDGNDAVATLMKSFSNMLGTIEQQAGDIDTFAARLDAAYKELEATNLKLKETSFKDEVTGLYNRRFFTLRLEEEISRFRRFAHPVSVVLLDLDGFKGINDELGHAGGDETLRQVAQILMKHSRGINVVSRYGGDEFAILLVETTKEGAQLYAERIRQMIAASPFAHGKHVTASFGVATLPDDEPPTGAGGSSIADALLRASDDALYAAKRAGKNQVFAAGAARRSG